MFLSHHYLAWLLTLKLNEYLTCQVFWIPYAFTKFGFLCAAIGGINGKDAPLIGIGTGNLFSEGRGVKTNHFFHAASL